MWYGNYYGKSVSEGHTFYLYRDYAGTWNESRAQKFVKELLSLKEAGMPLEVEGYEDVEWEWTHEREVLIKGMRRLNYEEWIEWDRVNR